MIEAFMYPNASDCLIGLGIASGEWFAEAPRASPDGTVTFERQVAAHEWLEFRLTPIGPAVQVVRRTVVSGTEHTRVTATFQSLAAAERFLANDEYRLMHLAFFDQVGRALRHLPP